MFFRLIASLRYRHWLAVSASLFTIGTLGCLIVMSRAEAGHLSGVVAACIASALVAVAISLRTLTTLPDAPRIRIRELETRTLGRPLFPQRRRLSRRLKEEWQPTVWSPDEITPWSPESDLE